MTTQSTASKYEEAATIRTMGCAYIMYRYHSSHAPKMDAPTDSIHGEENFPVAINLSLWRNRLARSAVNRKVGGSSPPRDDLAFSSTQHIRIYTFRLRVLYDY